MKHSKLNYFFLPLSLICLITFFSCRKKDERYEGNYIGTERYTYLDSGATTFSIDTTYNQEVEVSYDNAASPRKKIYYFTALNGNQNVWGIGKKAIIDHQYTDGYSGGHVKFSGDSLYLYTSNFSDNTDNWDVEVWEFKGKRN